MNIGLGLLRLPPDHFWSMTVRELEAAIGNEAGRSGESPPLVRSELQDLMQRYPD